MFDLLYAGKIRGQIGTIALKIIKKEKNIDDLEEKKSIYLNKRTELNEVKVYLNTRADNLTTNIPNVKAADGASRIIKAAIEGTSFMGIDSNFESSLNELNSKIYEYQIEIESLKKKKKSLEEELEKIYNFGDEE